MRIHPYLNFNGTCAEAMTFYQQCLGGELSLSAFGDSPIADQMPEETHHLVMHARLSWNESTVLMASDAPPDRFEKPAGVFVTLDIDDVAEAERVYGTLSQGGTIIMPLEPSFWAERFGMWVDRYGTHWMVSVARAD